MPESISDIIAMIKVLNTKMDTSMEKSDRNYETMVTRLDSQDVRISGIQDRVDCVEVENNKLKEKVNTLMRLINQTRQIQLNKNLIIRGIPEFEKTPNELKGLVMKTIAAVNPNVTAEDLINAERMGRQMNGKSRLILVELPSTKLRDNILAAKKKAKLNLAAIFGQQLSGNNGMDSIYFDEHVTKETMNLFIEAKKLRQLGAKFVWIKFGVVQVRLTEGGAITRIFSGDDIINLVGKMGPNSNKRRANSTLDGADLNATINDILMETGMPSSGITYTEIAGRSIQVEKKKSRTD